MPAAKARRLASLLALLLVVAIATPAAASIPRDTLLEADPQALLAAADEPPELAPPAVPVVRFIPLQEQLRDRFELLPDAALDRLVDGAEPQQLHLFAEPETRLRALDLPGGEQPQADQWFNPGIASGVPRGPNPYQYALNNPASYTDPMGLATWTIFGRDVEVPDALDAAVRQRVGRAVGAGAEIYDQVHGLWELSQQPGGVFGQMAESYGLEAEYMLGVALRLNEACTSGSFEACMGERDLLVEELSGHLWETSRGLPVLHTVDAGIQAARADRPFDRGVEEGRMAVRALEDIALIFGIRARIPAGAPDELVTVSRWGRPGLEPGDFVMKGPASRTNYVRSGKWQRGGGNEFAPFGSGQEYRVPRSTVRPPGEAATATIWDRGIFDWYKRLLGQRSYNPPPEP